MPREKPYPPEFKAKVSLEAMEGGATVNEIATKYDLNPNLVRNWKAKAGAELSRVFSVAEDERAPSGRRPCASSTKSTWRLPYLGARKMSRELRRRTKGRIDIGRKATANLMEEVNVRPAYPKPNLSKPAKHSRKHPYLLKSKAIRFPDQVWSVDMTYVSVGGSHMYLTCVIDWLSLCVVGWRLADDTAAPGVTACMCDALDEHGEPAIVNSDQGPVFNSDEYEGLLRGSTSCRAWTAGSCGRAGMGRAR
ncbi:DDE-type integrase/transposase/recombinase [Olsenella sp. Marseille-P4559]|uniref:DDE-type integrase/transposase/recombinase n=1 Tax=Olsenella sp. Marseille-P4559 TaxID=2364795 RepID=UPI0013EF1459|nr:DDE-type integrase/transposase/recombinase [Olsenella sp. Marseille-P4559]